MDKKQIEEEYRQKIASISDITPKGGFLGDNPEHQKLLKKAVKVVEEAKKERDRQLQILNKTNSTSRNRVAGHDWERQIVQDLVARGFIHAITSRLGSRDRDNEKIDIMNKDERKNGFLPFNIQAKIIARDINYQNILAEMPKGEKNVIAFKQTEKVGKRFKAQGTYAIMNLDTFYDYIEMERKYNELKREHGKLAQAYDDIIGSETP